MDAAATEKRLHIFYRHVHTMHNERSRDPGKTRPEWFSHEACFANLLRTLDASPYGHKVTLTVVYDGTAEDFETDFMHAYIATPRKYPVAIKIVQGGSNHKSWIYALAIAKNTPMGDQDLVYMMENDYLHRDGWLDKVAEIDASAIAFDYLALYDHADKYFLDMYAGLQSRIVVTASQHWRTTPSTCGTFILPRRVFLEDVGDWAQEVGDFHMFKHLTEDKGRVVLSPVPGLATHCMTGYLAPTIDWSKVT
jgi:hypothetical protein